MKTIIALLLLVTVASSTQAAQIGDMDGDNQVGLAEAIISLRVAAGQDPGVPLGTYDCPDGQTECSGSCVDTVYDPAHCGDCVTSCGAGNYCDDGSCKKFDGSSCTGDAECVSGFCIANECSQPKIVFVTSTTSRGNLGGLVGADAMCNERAASEGIGGTFLAWISDGTTAGSPAGRFMHSEIPYSLLNGVKIADNWADLTDGTLGHSINVNQRGETYSQMVPVWTNVDYDGTYEITQTNTSNNCIGFTSDHPGIVAVRGSTSYSTANWTSFSLSYCSTFMSLYCFQQ